jgi:hypothetical protein
VAELLPEPLVVSERDFRFGPGNVADIKERIYGPPEKAAALGKIPWKLRRLLGRDIPNITGLRILPLDWADLEDKERADEKLEAVLVDVHKNMKTARTICKEENAVMLFQQAQFAAAQRVFESGPMANFVNLRNQVRSRDAARYGSEGGLADTIDLASASDRVHTNLVRAIFPLQWVIPLLLTRSSRVVTPWGPVDVEKFAPMGSALCFPVQCVIFTAICVLAYARRMGIDTEGEGTVRKVLARCADTHDSAPSSWDLFSPAIIFGDDIICDGRTTTDVIALLQKFGFKVNHDKSFIGGQAVREACGIYAWAGYDITPIRYSVPIQEGAGLHPAVYASLIDLANRAHEFGYLGMRRQTIALLRQALGVRMDYVPFVSNKDAFGIYTDGKISNPPRSSSGARLRRKHRDWQVGQRKVMVVVSVQEEPAKYKKYDRSTGTFSQVNESLESYLYFRRLSRDPRTTLFHPVVKWMEVERKSPGRGRPSDQRLLYKWTRTG